MAKSTAMRSISSSRTIGAIPGVDRSGWGKRRVAVEGLPQGRTTELSELSRGQDRVVDQAGPASFADQFDGIAQRNQREHLDGLRPERTGDNGADADLVDGHGGFRP